MPYFQIVKHKLPSTQAVIVRVLRQNSPSIGFNLPSVLNKMGDSVKQQVSEEHDNTGMIEESLTEPGRLEREELVRNARNNVASWQHNLNR